MEKQRPKGTGMSSEKSKRSRHIVAKKQRNFFSVCYSNRPCVMKKSQRPATFPRHARDHRAQDNEAGADDLPTASARLAFRPPIVSSGFVAAVCAKIGVEEMEWPGVALGVSCTVVEKRLNIQRFQAN